MAVGSIFEMFLTTFGWHLYDIIWGIISSTGLAYLPLLAVIIDNVITPIQSQDAKSASLTSLRRLEVDIVRIIVMMVLAVAPSFSLQYSSISLTNSCEGRVVDQGESGTVLDSVFNPTLISGQEVKVPPAFYLVMSVAGGINDAFIAQLPCEVSLRQVATEVNTAVITNNGLRLDVMSFYNQCYDRAVAKYVYGRNVINDADLLEDSTWIGSQYFIDNYYEKIIPTDSVFGFPFDPSRLGDSSHYVEGNTEQILPENGYPNCKEWWSSPENGLRDRLVEEFPTDLYDRVNYLLQPDSLRAAEDATIAQAISNDHKLRVSADSQSWDRDDKGGMLLDYISGVVAMGGGVIADILIQPVTFAVIQGAPLVQSLMLMCTYFLLPWVLLFGNYEWKTIKTALLTVFAMKFWTSIWAVVSLLDNQLMKVIREASGNTGLLSLTNDMVLLKTLVDIAIVSLYIGLPFFFMSMLSWSGENQISQTNEASSNLSGAGKQAGQTGVNSVSKGFSK